MKKYKGEETFIQFELTKKEVDVAIKEYIDNVNNGGLPNYSDVIVSHENDNSVVVVATLNRSMEKQE